MTKQLSRGYFLTSRTKYMTRLNMMLLDKNTHQFHQRIATCKYRGNQSVFEPIILTKVELEQYETSNWIHNDPYSDQ